MSKHNVIELEKPEEIIQDHLSELLRVKARSILAEALELEIEAFMEEYKAYRLSDGRQRLVRHGYHQERSVQTGIGSVKVRVPRSKDRQTCSSGEAIQFSSKLIPPYLRRSKSIILTGFTDINATIDAINQGQVFKFLFFSIKTVFTPIFVPNCPELSRIVPLSF